MPAVRTSTILIAVVLTATLSAAACTAAGTPTAVTTTAPGSPLVSAPDTSAASTSAAPTSRAVITSIPRDTATGASVIDPVVVTAAGGTLDTVTMTNPDGKEVAGAVFADGTTWTSAEPLGYGRMYTIAATARDPAGLTTSTLSSFTTVTPGGVIFPSFEPPPDRGTVGVGHPIAVIFDKPPPDKAAAERALTVTTVPAQVGGWYWVDERTVHYRPQVYWQAGTQVTVNAKVYGVDLGGGFYGETDRTLNLTIGPSKAATIDDATKQMVVTIDGQVARQFPVSLGRDESVTVDGEVISFVTPSGIYVAQEKYPVRQMSSATYGLPTSYDLGYDQAIPLAVRLSNSGIFAHSAPWSVADQGIRNVSHGCINMPPDQAQWFYDTFSFGDIVQVTGTSTQLAPDDGYGDWNIPWEEWVQGSALT
jgi:lipoprotein-anchoring transpeptidase ErfK/SrfK